jgi:hypothetical protein
MKAKKLSDLLFNKTPLKIKDRVALLKIYEDYLIKDYFSVVKQIYDYDKNETVFFTDLALFLKEKYKNGEYKSAIYLEFCDIYFDKLNING